MKGSANGADGKMPIQIRGKMFQHPTEVGTTVHSILKTFIYDQEYMEINRGKISCFI